MTTFTWSSGIGSGDWAVAENWTPMGGPPNADTDGAILTGGTADYTVTIGPTDAFTADAVTLNDPLATLDVNGGLVLAGGTIGVDTGTLLLDQSGTISDGTITPAGGAIAFDGATLSTITWNGTLGLTADVSTPYGPDDATLRIEGTTDINQYTFQSLNVVGPGGAPGTIDLTGSGTRLDLVDNQTLNNVTIDIGATGTVGATLRAAASAGAIDGASVVLGQNTVIDQTAPNSLAIIASQPISSAPGALTEDAFGDAGTINAVAPGGTLAVTGFLEVSGALNVLNGETLLVDGPEANTGLYMGGSAEDATLTVDATSSVLAYDRFDLVGTVNIAAGGTFVLEPDAYSLSQAMVNGSLTDNGTLYASDGPLTITGDVAGSGTIEAEAGTLDVEGSVAGISLGFVPNANGLPHSTMIFGQPNSVTTAINNFTAETTIDLQGFFLTGSSYVGNVLTLSNAIGTVTINTDADYGTLLQVTEDPTTGDAIATIGSIATVSCFARGTRVATPFGEVAVEDLGTGNRVMILSGKDKPIKWTGHRRIDCRHHPEAHQVWPIRVRTGAFGERIPHRDLFLSPDHAVFANDVLIPIKRLINGTTIAQVPVDEVTYYHVELLQHDLILAEGMPAETYLDVGDRSNFANGGGLVEMYPDFALDEACEMMWEAAACAPLRIEGAAFDRVIAHLRSRAVALGQACARKPRRRSGSRSRKATDVRRLLDPVWYLANNPDVAAAGVDAAVHYDRWGHQEGRLPCNEVDLVRALTLVDPSTLVFAMDDVIDANVDPVAHFCNIGWRERRRPNPYFDTGWYLDTHNVPADTNPLLHYVLLGEVRGLLPSRHFDPAWYRQRYSIGLTESPLAHYLKHQRTRHFSPLPTFDVAAYVQAHATTLQPYRDPYAHFLAIGRSIPTRTDQARDFAA